MTPLRPSSRCTSAPPKISVALYGDGVNILVRTDLVSELRLRGIASRAAANAFLPEFLADFNHRFARPAQGSQPAWRRPPAISISS